MQNNNNKTVKLPTPDVAHLDLFVVLSPPEENTKHTAVSACPVVTTDYFLISSIPSIIHSKKSVSKLDT